MHRLRSTVWSHSGGFVPSASSFASVQAQIFLLIVLITAIVNYFIGTFITIESKKRFGFFGYDGTAASVFAASRC